MKNKKALNEGESKLLREALVCLEYPKQEMETLDLAVVVRDVVNILAVGANDHQQKGWQECQSPRVSHCNSFQ